MAERAMLERVSLTSYTQLSCFRRYIMAKPSVQAFVRELSVHVSFKEASWSVCFDGLNDLSTALANMSRLQSFKLLGHDMLSCIILSTHRASAQSLTAFHMILSGRDDACISIIGEFPQLTELSVVFRGDWLPSLDAVNPLVLPNIRIISLGCWEPMTVGISRFIRGCSFLNASAVTLVLSQMTVEDAPFLTDFLRSSIGFVSKLSLRIPPTVLSAPGLANVLSRCARHVEFLEFVPLPTFVDLWLAASPYAVSICSSVEGTELWAFLGRIATTGRQDVANKRNVFIRLNGSRFTWRCGGTSPAHAQFIGNLLGLALQLQEKGVLIHDEDKRR
jgi:hypothetical protein